MGTTIHDHRCVVCFNTENRIHELLLSKSFQQGISDYLNGVPFPYDGLNEPDDELEQIDLFFISRSTLIQAGRKLAALMVARGAIKNKWGHPSLSEQSVFLSPCYFEDL